MISPSQEMTEDGQRALVLQEQIQPEPENIAVSLAALMSVVQGLHGDIRKLREQVRYLTEQYQNFQNKELSTMKEVNDTLKEKIEEGRRLNAQMLTKSLDSMAASLAK